MHTKAPEVKTNGRLASEAPSWSELNHCVHVRIVLLLELTVYGKEFGIPQSLFLFLPHHIAKWLILFLYGNVYAFLVAEVVEICFGLEATGNQKWISFNCGGNPVFSISF